MASGIDRVAGFARGISPKFLRSDVIAQLFRVRLFADQLRVRALDVAAAQSESSRLAVLRTFQSDDPNPRRVVDFGSGAKAVRCFLS